MRARTNAHRLIGTRQTAARLQHEKTAADRYAAILEAATHDAERMPPAKRDALFNALWDRARARRACGLPPIHPTPPNETEDGFILMSYVTDEEAIALHMLVRAQLAETHGAESVDEIVAENERWWHERTREGWHDNG